MGIYKAGCFANGMNDCPHSSSRPIINLPLSHQFIYQTRNFTASQSFRMQLNAIFALVAMTSAVSAVSLPVRADSDLELLANGLYETFVDESGNTTTKFTPDDEVAVSARGIPDASLEARSQLAKRREGCGGALSTSDSDQANARLLDLFGGDRVYLSAGQKSAVCALIRLSPPNPNIAIVSPLDPGGNQSCQYVEW